MWEGLKEFGSPVVNDEVGVNNTLKSLIRI